MPISKINIAQVFTGQLKWTIEEAARLIGQDAGLKIWRSQVQIPL